jgi:predicted nucleic acid-binding protein
MDCFDSDVLIYTVITDHPLGIRVRALFSARPDQVVGVGSTILIPEILIKPVRLLAQRQADELKQLLGRLDLHVVNDVIAETAVELGARYGLRAPDAIHLATAVAAGADRFITNNRRDFGKDIAEADVTYPDELPPATSSQG